MEERSSTLLVPLEFIGKVWEDTRKEKSEIAASADQTTIQSLSATASVESWRWDQNGRDYANAKPRIRRRGKTLRGLFLSVGSGQIFYSFQSYAAL